MELWIASWHAGHDYESDTYDTIGVFSTRDKAIEAIKDDANKRFKRGIHQIGESNSFKLARTRDIYSVTGYDYFYYSIQRAELDKAQEPE